MEVHHHPHVEKKSFKEYLLEGLMIFLAVSMGFIAENIREHFTEKRLRVEYVESFYEDLKTDTARIVEIINFDQQKLNALKNMGMLYDSIEQKQTLPTTMRNLIKSTSFSRPFTISEKTIKQLASTGAFRLLDKEDADSITKYEISFNTLNDFQLSSFHEAQVAVRNTLQQIVKFKYFFEVRQDTKVGLIPNNEIESVVSPFLGNTVDIDKYFNQLLEYNSVISAHQRILKCLEQNQISLIRYFKNKYHLE